MMRVRCGDHQQLFAIKSVRLFTCGALLGRRRSSCGLLGAGGWSSSWGIVDCLGDARPDIVEAVLAHVVNVAGLPELPSHLVLVGLLLGRLAAAQADVGQGASDSGLQRHARSYSLSVLWRRFSRTRGG